MRNVTPEHGFIPQCLKNFKYNTYTILDWLRRVCNARNAFSVAST